MAATIYMVVTIYIVDAVSLSLQRCRMGKCLILRALVATPPRRLGGHLESPLEVTCRCWRKKNRRRARAGARSAADNSQPSLFQIMDEVERRIIIDMLERTAWNQTEAAERFLIPLSTLNQKIKRLGIDVRRRGRGDDTFAALSAK